MVHISIMGCKMGCYNYNMKTCTRCNIEKPLNKFDKTPAGNKRNICEACRWKAKSSEYHAKRRAKGKSGGYRKSNLLKYNLTIEQYDAIVKKQNNLCAICEGNNFGKHDKLFVDHDHFTKKVRGLLCINCNTLLGNAKDSPQILERAIRYLEITK